MHCAPDLAVQILSREWSLGLARNWSCQHGGCLFVVLLLISTSSVLVVPGHHGSLNLELSTTAIRI